MAWVTKLGPNAEQVAYRLRDDAGCGQPVRAIDTDAAVAYRMDHAAEGLTWIGRGLGEFGIDAGTALTGEEDKQAAVRLMSGRDPHTGEKLVRPELRVDPRAKLAAVRLVDALDIRAEAAGISVEQLLDGKERLVKRVAQARRGIAAAEDRYLAPVGELEAIAAAAGIKLDDLYDTNALATARQHAAARVDIRNRGYDLTVETTKSYSVLHALAGPELAGKLEDIFDRAMHDTFAAAEQWCSFGLRGRNCDGDVAEPIATSGLAGWVMKHHTARPVAGAFPDPHLHAHIVVANMAKGVDGQWGAIAAGGRDLHRHAKALDGLFKARIRHLSRVELGVEWARHRETGAWEITAISRRVRDAFSKRHRQVAAQLEKMGIDIAAASRAQTRTAAAASAEPKAAAPITNIALRADWRTQAAAAGVDVAGLLAAAAPGPQAVTAVDLAPEALAKVVFDPETGLTAHSKRFTHAAALAAVADAAAPGLASTAQLEELTAAVLRVRGPGINHAIALNRTDPGYFTHRRRYTTIDLARAEATILDATRTRLAHVAAEHPAVRVAPGVTAMAISTFEASAGFTLSAEQRAVIERLTTAGHGIEGVIGVAGSGKTTIMDVLRTAHEAAGHTIAGASTAAVAAHHLEAETRIPSGTIASWLARPDGLSGVDVLVIDEAGMTDDRDMARLVTEAGRAGTQLVAIGDPLQLASPGVGSTFADIHAIVDGLMLTENRRQTEETHRKALEVWRAGARADAVQALADAGSIHTGDTIDDVHAAMIRDWDTKRRTWDDPHDRIHGHLMLAGTRADVAALNDAAQALRLHSGELNPLLGRDYRVPGGQWIRLHPGDHVLVRRNDYHRHRPVPLLNGFRGIVTHLNQDTGDVTIAWRATGDASGRLATPQTVTAEYIRTGGLDLAYALTVHKAQGQTAQHTTIHLTGLDPHAAYPALSRHRGSVDAWIARDVAETDTDRLTLGNATTDTERLARAIDAYTRTLQHRETDPLVLAELGDHDRLIHRRRDRESVPQARESVESPTQPWPEVPWWDRDWGHLHDDELEQRLSATGKAFERAAHQLVNAHERDRQVTEATAEARNGRGPRALKLAEARVHLDTADDQWRASKQLQHEETANDKRIGRIVKELGAARQQRDRNRLILRLTGTSRREQAEHVDAIEQRLYDAKTERERLYAEIRESRDTAGLAEGRAQDHVRAADIWLHKDNGSYRAEGKHLRDNWDTYQRNAIQQDVNAAGHAGPSRLPDTNRAQRNHDQLYGQVADLTHEKHVRAGLTSDHTAAEHHDRTAARHDIDAQTTPGPSRLATNAQVAARAARIIGLATQAAAVKRRAAQQEADDAATAARFRRAQARQRARQPEHGFEPER